MTSGFPHKWPVMWNDNPCHESLMCIAKQNKLPNVIISGHASFEINWDISHWSGVLSQVQHIPKNINIPDSKVHGANMGPTWVLSAPDGPHVGSMNLAIRGASCLLWFVLVCLWWILPIAIKVTSYARGSSYHRIYQTLRIWVNKTRQSDTHQSNTKPCQCFMGYNVWHSIIAYLALINNQWCFDANSTVWQYRMWPKQMQNSNHRKCNAQQGLMGKIAGEIRVTHTSKDQDEKSILFHSKIKMLINFSLHLILWCAINHK